MMPNFLIIGATKSGTTSIYEYLSQHPDIYMSPKKEPHFFAFRSGESVEAGGPGDSLTVQQMFVTDEQAYKALFQGASSERARGEASAMYIYYPLAAQQIKASIPEVKLIAIFRNPIERAYSSYLHLIREGRETHAEFADALRAEANRIEAGWLPLWHYKTMGYYHEQLKRYYDLFDPEQIKVYLYEDLQTDPVAMMKDIFQHIGVDESFTPDMSIKHNISGVPKNPWLHQLHHFLKKPHPTKAKLKPLLPDILRRTLKMHLIAYLESHNLQKPPIVPEVRQHLIKAYRRDILRLQNLIERDLSHWLE